MRPIEPIEFRNVLSAYPTGVCAVTSMMDDGRLLGMIVGSFTSVSLDPPLVGFLPSRSSYTWSLIGRVGRFCVNVLSADQLFVCDQLAMPGLDEKLAGLDYAVTEHQLPALAGGIATIECNIHSVLEAGDHWFVIGSVIALSRGRGSYPLLFHDRRYGGFAELKA